MARSFRFRRGASRAAPAGGFTLVELLVVIAIIVILATISVMMASGFLRGYSVKDGGRILQASFARARQVASTKRMPHFLVFNTATSTMTLYEDTDRNKQCSNSLSGTAVTGADKLADAPIDLPRNVYFDRVFGQTTGAPYAAFFPDGTVVFYRNLGNATIEPDISWGTQDDHNMPDQGPSKSDIVLKISKETKSSDKAYCDIVGITGIMRKIVYRRTEDPEGKPLN